MIVQMNLLKTEVLKIMAIRSTDVKGSIPTRDIKKSQDERSDNKVIIMNNETNGNSQSNQNGVKTKYVIGDSMVKHIKGWNLSNNLNQNYNT